MMQQIKQELLNEWKKEGELLIIFGCEYCHKKIPFYRTDNELVNRIYLDWVRNNKYCYHCEKKLHGNNSKKKEKIPRINRLLEIYEPDLMEIETFK